MADPRFVVANLNQRRPSPFETTATSKRLSDKTGMNASSTHAAKPAESSGSRQSQAAAGPTIQPEIIACTHDLLDKMLSISRSRPTNVAATTSMPHNAPLAPPSAGKEVTKSPLNGAEKLPPSPGLVPLAELPTSKTPPSPHSSPGKVGVTASIIDVLENDERSLSSSALLDSSPDEMEKPAEPGNDECSSLSSAFPESSPHNPEKPVESKVMLSASKASERGTPAPARHVTAAESDGEGELSVMDILHKIVGAVPDSKVQVPGKLLLELLESHRNIKDRLDGAVDKLLDYQENLSRWKIAKDYFVYNIQKSGFDAEDLWSKSYRHADAWLDPVLAGEEKYTGVTTEDVDEECWLADIFRSRGINVPDRRRKDKPKVTEELKAAEEPRPSPVSFPEGLGLALQDLDRSHQKGTLPKGDPPKFFAPLPSRYTAEAPAPKINPRPELPTDIKTEDIGIDLEPFQRPMSPPVFHLLSKEQNQRWPGQVKREKAVPEIRVFYPPGKEPQMKDDKKVSKRDSTVPAGCSVGYVMSNRSDMPIIVEQRRPSAGVERVLAHKHEPKQEPKQGHTYYCGEFDILADNTKGLTWYEGGSPAEKAYYRSRGLTPPVRNRPVQLLNSPYLANGKIEPRYRRVVITQLPRVVGNSEALDMIRGGPFEKMLIRECEKGTTSKRLEVTFLHCEQAWAYFQWLKIGPVYFRETVLQVEMEAVPPLHADIQDELFDHLNSRILSVRPPRGQLLSMTSVRKFVEGTPLPTNLGDIFTTQISIIPAGTTGLYKIEFTNLRTAIYTKQFLHGKGWSTWTAGDPTCGRISELPKSRVFGRPLNNWEMP